MQIQYCDTCGQRIDEEDVMLADGRPYCKECAPANARNALATQRQSRGVGNMSPLLNQARRTTGAHQVRSATPNKKLTAARTPVNHHAPATSAPFAAPAENAGGLKLWVSNNMIVALGAGAAVLIGLCLVVMWALTPPKPKAQSNTNANVTTPTPPVPANNTPPVVAAVPEKVAPPVPPVNPTDTAPGLDLRENSARAMLDKIKQSKTENDWDKRRLYAKFLEVDWRTRTAPGKEAQEILKTLPDIHFRPADDAGKTYPGVTARYVHSKPESVDFAAFPASAKEVMLPSPEFIDERLLKPLFGADKDLAIRFTGFLEFPNDGDYTLHMASDDGSFLYIGGNLLIDNGGSHAIGERSTVFPAKAGKHAFRLDYWQGIGEAGLVLYWSSPNLQKQRIPASAFSTKDPGTLKIVPVPEPKPKANAPLVTSTPRPPDGAPSTTLPGLKVFFYDNPKPEKSFEDLKIIGESVAKTIEIKDSEALKAFCSRKEYVSLRYTGFLEVPVDGTYTFRLKSDDGSRMFLGDTLVVDNPWVSGANSHEVGASIPLKAGKHALRVDYTQGATGAFIFLKWSGPTSVEGIIPPSQLSYPVGK